MIYIKEYNTYKCKDITEEDFNYIKDCFLSVSDKWNLKDGTINNSYTDVTKIFPFPDYKIDDGIFTGEYCIYHPRNSDHNSSVYISITIPFIKNGDLLDKFKKSLNLFNKRLNSRDMGCLFGNKTGKRGYSGMIRSRKNTVPIREWDLCVLKGKYKSI